MLILRGGGYESNPTECRTYAKFLSPFSIGKLRESFAWKLQWLFRITEVKLHFPLLPWKPHILLKTQPDHTSVCWKELNPDDVTFFLLLPERGSALFPSWNTLVALITLHWNFLFISKAKPISSMNLPHHLAESLTHSRHSRMYVWHMHTALSTHSNDDWSLHKCIIWRYLKEHCRNNPRSFS